jgi:hypothetical protein
MKSWAHFSSDRRFRYQLIREWDEDLPKACFIGLNPSTADETVDDPTIRRCLGFAKAWGKGGLLMLNLYAFRATIPAEMWKAQKRGVDIIGGWPNWVDSLKKYVSEQNCDVVVAAWGAHGAKRQSDVTLRWPSLMCLAKNSDGTPKHPLYLRADLVPMEFTV